MPGFPDEVQVAIDALVADGRVDRASLDIKVRQLQSHLGRSARHISDLGAELRVAVELLRRVREIESLSFPEDDPPDILVRYRGESIPIEVAHLREGDRGPSDSDVRFRAAEDFDPALLAQPSEPEAGDYVRRQIALKIERNPASRGGILVVATDSATNKWTLVACSGIWAAAAEKAVGGGVLPFAEVVVWYCGPRMVDMPRRIFTNASLRTETAAAFVEEAYRAIRPFEVPGPGDSAWRREHAERLLARMRRGGEETEGAHEADHVG